MGRFSGTRHAGTRYRWYLSPSNHSPLNQTFSTAKRNRQRPGRLPIPQNCYVSPRTQPIPAKNRFPDRVYPDENRERDLSGKALFCSAQLSWDSTMKVGRSGVTKKSLLRSANQISLLVQTVTGGSIRSRAGCHMWKARADSRCVRIAPCRQVTAHRPPQPPTHPLPDRVYPVENRERDQPPKYVDRRS